MIKAIIFDAGGVLFNSAETLFKGPIEYITKVTDEPQELVDKAYRETLIECESRKVRKKELWDRVSKKLGREIPFAGQNPIGEGFKRFKRNEDVFSLIDQLKLKYKLAIVSNANAVEARTVQALSIYKQFDVVVLSYKIGARKPHPRIYQTALNRLQVKPDEIVFIDNASENVDEANKLGMKGIVYEDFDQLKQDLKKLVLV